MLLRLFFLFLFFLRCPVIATSEMSVVDKFATDVEGRQLTYSQACSAVTKCKHLSGNCCPTDTGVYLSCCPNRKCRRYPACYGLSKLCCPTENGVMLDCCFSSQNTHTCGMKGDKCDVNLQCCSQFVCKRGKCRK